MKSEYRELVNEVLRKIGRNILMFQQIEKGLKLLLPFIHSDASAKGIDSFWKYREAAKLKTLGNLINAFIESADYDTDYFVERLREIVAERNKLVHHFGESEGLNILSTEEGCKTCIIYLESQYQEAIYFYKKITLFVFCVVVFLQGNYAESNPDIEFIYKQLKAYIISSDVEYINMNNPSETTWENTKIVKLLRLAETNTDKIGDMTLLARAGEFIKSQDSECTPKQYGIKTLKGVLKASGLFEITESQVSEQNSVFILYKSKLSH
ncbi:OST-HTH/LOTUS domain-containing protein [aff. Roholtiella sp. LEGE 12411]|uniref:OST-HTH/LOTUS domain-containing protein n=1 Tax=aff. Roholtiella sp. LEGE 12411 TaxID=1828822 RepID=UPI0018820A44|nr:OST-HTH/LOTUS domain-containing protein [aff. Roholtiella sp. LEGE 12411]MBE9036993.1 OST-HTH/LOTUS domain-containing protein [aff. Roholtiella sp. LEGE 12411]